MTSRLIWISTVFSDRIAYLAVNGRRGVYELRGRRAAGTLDLTVDLYLNDKLLSADFTSYDDAATTAAEHEAGPELECISQREQEWS